MADPARAKVARRRLERVFADTEFTCSLVSPRDADPVIICWVDGPSEAEVLATCRRGRNVTECFELCRLVRVERALAIALSAGARAGAASIATALNGPERNDPSVSRRRVGALSAAARVGHWKVNAPLAVGEAADVAACVMEIFGGYDAATLELYASLAADQLVSGRVDRRLLHLAACTLAGEQPP